MLNGKSNQSVGIAEWQAIHKFAFFDPWSRGVVDQALSRLVAKVNSSCWVGFTSTRVKYFPTAHLKRK